MVVQLRKTEQGTLMKIRFAAFRNFLINQWGNYILGIMQIEL